jgi:hypothetical protein
MRLGRVAVNAIMLVAVAAGILAGTRLYGLFAGG